MREYLRGFRKAAGASQKSIAEKMQIARQYYNLIENGSRQKNISLSMLEKLAAAFGVPVANLIEAEQRYRAGIVEREAG